MTTMTTQGYMSPSPYRTANMFAQPTSRDSSKGGELLGVFGTAGTISRTVGPQQTEESPFASMVNLTKITSLPHGTTFWFSTRFKLGLYPEFNG